MADATEDDATYDFAPEEPAKKVTPAPKPASPPKSKPRRTDLLPPNDPAGFERTQEAAPPAESAAENICMHCGFKYYGKVKARCPECAAPVEPSADLLQ